MKTMNAYLKKQRRLTTWLFLAGLFTLTSCEWFKKDIVPQLLFNAWKGTWVNTGNTSAYPELNFVLKKDNSGTNQIFMRYKYPGATQIQESDELTGELGGDDPALPSGPDFENSPVSFYENMSLGELKYIRYVTRIRKSDNRLLMVTRYLRSDYSEIILTGVSGKVYEFSKQGD